MAEVSIAFKARPYQQELIEWYRKGGKKAFALWHRKAGKDRTATFIESELAWQQPGLYWHALPKYEEARKVVWDAIMPDGHRLVDWAFPKPYCKHLDHEMKVILPNGSIWQPVGTDNYNALVGAFPRHITWSEFALGTPAARNFLRPALAMNNGTELVITTPRGYNHAFDLFEDAKTSPDWFVSIKTVDDTHAMPEAALAEERRTMPDEMFRQEYYLDWSAANVGSILGRYIEAAEKEGRISDDVEYDRDGADIIISSDIGRRHISAFWFWQPQTDGFSLVDYDEDAGLEAGEWIDRLEEKITANKYRLNTIFLPHDAKAKTFQAKHSPVERFLRHYGGEHVKISPQTKKEHSINAGQVVIRKCRFNKTRCERGLKALRAWAYEYDDERKQYSRSPVDDWAADASDAFCEGAKMLKERVIAAAEPTPSTVVKAFVEHKLTLDELYEQAEQSRGSFNRI